MLAVRKGVWLSDEPPDESDGAHGDILLEIEAAFREAEITGLGWEVVEAPKLHSDREFCIPAAILNARSRVRHD